MDQHDFAHGPLDGFYALLGHAMVVAQQRDMRRVGTRPVRFAVQRVAQALLQDIEADRAVIAA